MIGVLITRDALMISLIRGTPRVICALLGQGSPQSTHTQTHTHSSLLLDDREKGHC